MRRPSVRLVLTQPVIVFVVLSVLAVMLLMSFVLQLHAERGALSPIGRRQQRERAA